MTVCLERGSKYACFFLHLVANDVSEISDPEIAIFFTLRGAQYYYILGVSFLETRSSHVDIGFLGSSVV
jgi:hypothetical protein